MEASFTFDLSEDVKVKPLPCSLGKRTKNKRVDRIKQIDYYPILEIEFFDVLKQCAENIDKLNDVEKRLKYTQRLNKIFVIRHKGSLMQLFRELVTPS